ncbi:hypothetical protein DAMA08_053020 [Martiniozyma asiatica (nom. inval.)]|nr:hypothetical protein DAMA08_053020 [Martiniozyma asiatica]
MLLNQMDHLSWGWNLNFSWNNWDFNYDAYNGKAGQCKMCHKTIEEAHILKNKSEAAILNESTSDVDTVVAGEENDDRFEMDFDLVFQIDDLCDDCINKSKDSKPPMLCLDDSSEVEVEVEVEVDGEDEWCYSLPSLHGNGINRKRKSSTEENYKLWLVEGR